MNDNSEPRQKNERLQEEMEVPKERNFHHFSHQHPLQLYVSPSATKTCNACNLFIKPGTKFYSCKACSFSLHQVCSSISRKTNHPAHPNHALNLFVLSPSENSTFSCKACPQNLTGFYYSCAECGIYYHILCLALPLSLTTNSHHHPLKIEFSPPYDFCCDLCRKPSYRGWLYRCRFCEFDAHISCAISSQKTKNLETELMQLVIQRVGLGNEVIDEQEVADSGSGDQTKRYKSGPSSVSEDGSKNHDLAPPASDDYTIPSYQFSDLCFSIDLINSYSSHDHIDQVSSHQNDAMAGTISKTQQVERHDSSNKTLLNPPYKGPENTLNPAYINGGVARSDEKKSDERRRENGCRSKSEISERSVKSVTENSIWGKLLTCCYHPNYEKCSKSFKNGGGI